MPVTLTCSKSPAKKKKRQEQNQTMVENSTNLRGTSILKRHPLHSTKSQTSLTLISDLFIHFRDRHPFSQKISERLPPPSSNHGRHGSWALVDSQPTRPDLRPLVVPHRGGLLRRVVGARPLLSLLSRLLAP